MKQYFTFFPTLKKGLSRRLNQNLSQEVLDLPFRNIYPDWLHAFFKKAPLTVFIGSFIPTSFPAEVTGKSTGMQVWHVSDENSGCAEAEKTSSIAAMNPRSEFPLPAKSFSLLAPFIGKVFLEYQVKAHMFETPTGSNTGLSCFFFSSYGQSHEANFRRRPLLI